MTQETLTMRTDRSSSSPRPGSRTEWIRVAAELDDLCAQSNPGDRIPTHLELMRQMNASQRAVLRALGELQRRGRIERRHGSGTYVSGRSRSSQPSGLVSRDSASSNAVRNIVAVTNPDNSFFDFCIALLYEQTADANIDVACRLVDSNDPDVALNGWAYGANTAYIVFQYKMLPLAMRLNELGHRVVVVGTPPVGERITLPTVSGDQEQGGYLACDHAIQLGHRRIAFAHPVENMQQQPRWRGHVRAIEDAAKRGVEIKSSILTKAETAEWIANNSLANEYLAQPDASTMIVAWNDHEALELANVLEKAGISVPSDVSLIGYDALPTSDRAKPSLTTIDGMVKQQLDAAIRLLTNHAEPPQGCKLIVSPKLIVRQSAVQVTA